MSKTEGDMGSTIDWIDQTIVTITSRLFVACPLVMESFDVVIDWMLLGIDVRGSGRLVSCHLNQSIKKWATNPDMLAKYLCFHFFWPFAMHQAWCHHFPSPSQHSQHQCSPMSLSDHEICTGKCSMQYLHTICNKISISNTFTGGRIFSCTNTVACWSLAF